MHQLLDYFKTQFDIKDNNPRQYSPLVLAFIGDAVFDLIIKTKIVNNGNAPVNVLHRNTSKYVKASAQANLFRVIEENLTDEEFSVFRRGRNAKSSSVPKNADLMDYKVATGFECLIGFLYLNNEFERIIELVSRGVNENND